MKRIIICLLLASSSAFAGDFKKTIYLRNWSYPVLKRDFAQKLEEFKTQCASETAKIEDKVKAVAQSANLAIENLKVEAQTGAETGSGYEHSWFCSATISGTAPTSIQFVQLKEMKNHLKAKGYKREDFNTACADIAKAFASNPNEIWQKSAQSSALINGNYCSVRSLVLVSM